MCLLLFSLTQKDLKLSNMLCIYFSFHSHTVFMFTCGVFSFIMQQVLGVFLGFFSFIMHYNHGVLILLRSLVSHIIKELLSSAWNGNWEVLVGNLSRKPATYSLLYPWKKKWQYVQYCTLRISRKVHWSIFLKP